MYNLVDIHFHTDDSYDAYNGHNFDVEKLVEVLKDTDDEKTVKLLCKTDHNILNFRKYKELADQLKSIGTTLLPGIEINSAENVHWLFIFDDVSLGVGLLEDDDYYGDVLDNRINEFFSYDMSAGHAPLKDQAREKQNEVHNLRDFISILHELNIPYIAIPHLNKTKGWYEKLKKDEAQLAIVEEFLNSNIINGFESKNQDDFIGKNITETESHIQDLQRHYDALVDTLTESQKQKKIEDINRRIEHLQKLTELDRSISNGDASLIYGSDFHCRGNETIESYKNYKSKLFYMKAASTFEGLRISLLDQFSRIFSVTRKDKFSKEAVVCIDRIRVKVNNQEKEIILGDGLNSVIGARGTGKSYFLNMLINKIEKYKGSSIYDDIILKEIVLANGEIKKFLSPSDYDILTQRGTNIDKGQNENSIYGLLADAPYKMDAYLKEIESLTKGKIEERRVIQDDIQKVNRQFDLFIQLNELRMQSIDFSYIKTYDSFYIDESDKIRVGDLIYNVHDYVNDELQRISRIINEVKSLDADVLKLKLNIGKLNKIKELSDLNLDFSGEQDMLEKLQEEKLTKLSLYMISRREKFDALVKIVERCSNIMHESSTNTLNVINHNIIILKTFVEKAINVLREVKSANINLREQFSKASVDETLYTLDVGRSKFLIKTTAELNFFHVSKNIFENMFNRYRISYSSDILLKCLNVTDYGRFFIENLYEKRDKRFGSYYLEFPQLEKQLYLDFGNGEFKNWAVLSPGERADKLLDIVLNGNSGKILLIDQPEDDLDNETIYRTLVNKIRELKLRRQIITVTHNANVAITGDSDRLIVCQNEDDHFSCYADGIESLKNYNYVSINSRIENKRILLIAAEILDGGKEALRKRVRKIGYKDIFYKG